jgi:integrase
MPSLTITTRQTASGPRYVVRYRLGGRAYPLIHAGSFKTLREAKTRRDSVAAELAAGRNPALLLKPVMSTPKHRTLVDWWAAWLETRKDIDPNSLRTYQAAGQAFEIETFKTRDITSLRPSDFQEWVAGMQEQERSASTIHTYMAAARQALDFADVDPNPARSRKVRLPRVGREEPTPPPADHLELLLRSVTPEMALALVTIEQGCLRVNEAETLVWGDVDYQGSRLRLRSANTKSARSRWVNLPAWLMERIGDTCPPEDRFENRRVFAGFTAQRARVAMTRACRARGIPHYHPHDLRHRRATLWHHSGMPARELAERGGWTKASLPLDVYTHTMPLGEVPKESLEALLVWSRCGLEPPKIRQSRL